MGKLYRLGKLLLILVVAIGLVFVSNVLNTAQASMIDLHIAGSGSHKQVYLVRAISQNEPYQVNMIRVFDSTEQARAAVPNDDLILGILYADVNYGGRTYIVYGNSCDYGIWYLSGFNDVISSLYNGCLSVVLYTDFGFSGPSQLYSFGGTRWVGDAMNDKASSVKFLNYGSSNL